MAARRAYAAKDYSRLYGVPGFSDELLSTHFKLYEGYVTHTNRILELLREPGLDDYAKGEARRRLAWEFNGMRLHELYFDGMALDPGDGEALQEALGRQWGSFGKWQADFMSVGAMRGIGWAVLLHDPAADRFLNAWINEHDSAPLAGTTPVILMDLFEHAYLQDHGLDKDAYTEAFAKAIDWQACERRWTDATARTEAHDTPQRTRPRHARPAANPTRRASTGPPVRSR